MNTELVTAAAEPAADHRMLVALSPSDVPAQQAHLIDFCKRKVAELAQDRSDLLDNIRVAKTNQWAFLSLSRAEKKLAARIVYYEKIQAAVEAGYLVVPNFEVEVMAVRVHRPAHRYSSDYAGSRHVQKAMPTLAPVGDGVYVDDTNLVSSRSWTEPDPKQPNQCVTKTQYETAGYNEEIDFPVVAIKPVVMEATALAMSKRIFDRIGVVTGKKEDPVVVGQIIDPRSKSVWHHQPDRMVTFFIAWWLDTRTL